MRLLGVENPEDFPRGSLSPLAARLSGVNLVSKAQ